MKKTNIKNILVTNNHFNILGGSEVWTYCLVNNLNKLGFNVYLFIHERINKKGILFKNLKKKKINIYEVNIPKINIDLILANHTSTIKKLINFYDKKIIIQTCHGIYPLLEQPFNNLNHYVSVSREIQKHLKKKNINSNLIYNGIDTETFFPFNPINKKIKNILSLVQDNIALNNIKKVCNELNINLIHFSKAHKSIFEIEKVMNKVDLVITVGRGVLESLSCGRNVISYDSRKYYTNKPMGHGLLKSNEEILNALSDNFTGRNDKKIMTNEQLKNEILKYNELYGKIGRNFIMEHCDIKKNIEKYINIIN
jgi:hypothetical protein